MAAKTKATKTLCFFPKILATFMDVVLVIYMGTSWPGDPHGARNWAAADTA
jgi:hypothetical protein